MSDIVRVGDLEIRQDLGYERRALRRSRSPAPTCVNDIQPQREGQTVLPDRIVYTFDLQPPTQVKFFTTFREAGAQKATVWGPDGRRLSYTQFVYP